MSAGWNMDVRWYGAEPLAKPGVLPGESPVEHRSIRAKRVFDLCAAALLLVLLAPLMIAIAMAIRITSPGPALFRQRRIGYRGRSFVMLKFRTMRENCSEQTHREYVTRMLNGDESTTGGSGLYKLHADPRVTPVGRLLRRTSLDEIPQLLNVVKGEMSLVGPRPVLPYEAELFEPRHQARFRVPPGLTGLWQVSGRNRLSMRQALELDLEYIRRRSLRLDLILLLKTVLVLVARTDAE
jgi:lipopolysaccharide/colanic/teichoic acid biosynthesis glycosyltransferase